MIAIFGGVFQLMGAILIAALKGVLFDAMIDALGRR